MLHFLRLFINFTTMKKKNYLDKAGKGVLIGTSVIILGGMAGCSEMPNDTSPTLIATKGAPVGPPGAIDWSTFAANTCPTINPQKKCVFYLNEYKDCSFKIVVPIGYKYLTITQFQSPRTIPNLKAICSTGILNLGWLQTENTIKIQVRPDGSRLYPPFNKDMELTIELHSATETPLYIIADYTN